MINKNFNQNAAPSASLPPRQISLTVFQDLGAKTKEAITTTLPELAERIRSTQASCKAALPLLSGCRFGDQQTKSGSLRNNANAQGAAMAVGEHDKGTVPLATVLAQLKAAGIEALCYPTPSHSPEKPRWRVLAPFSRELPPNQYSQMQDRLNGALGGVLSPESWALSQSFYFGFVEGTTAEVFLIEGTPIDRLNRLDASAIGRPGGGHSGKTHEHNPDHTMAKGALPRVLAGHQSQLSQLAMRAPYSFDEVAAAVASFPDGYVGHPLSSGDMWRRWFLFPLADFAARNPETAASIRKLFLGETRRIADPEAVESYKGGAEAYFAEAEWRFDHEVSARGGRDEF